MHAVASWSDSGRRARPRHYHETPRPPRTESRPWRLDPLPLIIDDADWQQLTTGIAQRAQLLEMVLRDLYGEGRLVAEGAVPAAASRHAVNSLDGRRAAVSSFSALRMPSDRQRCGSPKRAAAS